ncbi:hypothetical protein LIER_03709 [Lithospermum erythrorhizon]|uniref:RING-type domain-containing protein n=1 Tax=Lithospermum erythrorhizon TaxID=34254 RepID=A0AAV3NVA7_LITER
MMADDDSTSASGMVRNITICLIAAASAGVIITIYHCITANSVRDILNSLRRRDNRANQLHHQQRQTFSMPRQDHQATPNSLETSIAQLIPSYKYQKGGDHEKGVVDKDDGMCPVCLSDFEDGEEIRTLPGCLHSFHAPCIDMWLFSHPNCPMCRSIATPSPRMLLHLINSNPESPVTPNMQNHYVSPIDRLV